MTINGKIKFFEKSKILYKDGATATALTNSASAKLILDISKYTAYISVGSSDGVTEEIIIIPSSSVAVDRLFLIDINFKVFNVQYFSGGMWTDFINVVGLDGALVGGISETTFSNTSAYYEVTKVTVEKLRIQVSHTQTVNEEKSINSCVITNESYTLEGYPKYLNPRSSNNLKSNRSVNGLLSIDKLNQIIDFTLSFQNYPSKNDFIFINSLFDQQESFLVWLCGGVYEETDLRFQLRGWKLEDLLNMQTGADFFPRFVNSILVGPWNADLRLNQVLPS